jgi:aminodeoxyfutalosine deaminase
VGIRWIGTICELANVAEYCLMRKIASEWLFTGKELLKNGVLVLSDEGEVVSFESTDHAASGQLSGLVSPAFVNAHCHLELSHLRGKISTGTGMTGFIRMVRGLRDDASQAEKVAAMESAMAEMRAGGIAAVADICNGSSSMSLKAAHPEIAFYNFIELFGLDPNQAEDYFFRGLEMLKEFGKKSSITLHAPYSISRTLRDKVIGYATRREWPLSIHLLESADERQLFEDLEGPLLEFIQEVGAVFQAHTYNSPVDFIFEQLPAQTQLLLVHNTEMSSAEVERIVAGWPMAHFVLCPLANRYIHGKLPAAPIFAKFPDRICIGTDSLAGNHQLSILAEIHALQEAFGLQSDLLLRWATINGAKALGMDPRRFELSAGSQPCLIHIPAFGEKSGTLPEKDNIQFLQQ